MNDFKLKISFISLIAFIFLNKLYPQNSQNKSGFGIEVPKEGELIFDGTEKMLHDKWTYWEGPRLSAKLPIKWKIEQDPLGKEKVLNAFDLNAKNGKYGAADIVTKKKYNDLYS